MSSDKFMQRLAERRARGQDTDLTSTLTPTAPNNTTTSNIDPRYQHAIPDVDDTPSVSPEQQYLDDWIANLGIAAAYNRWARKGTVLLVPAGRKDSIKVRCPNPSHPDKNPSAWLNVEKNVYHCAACSMGGDLWDIAAWYFGFPVPGYKNDPQTFRQLREMIGQDFGISITKNISGGTSVTLPAEPVTLTTPVTPAAPENTINSTVTYLPSGAEYDETELASTDDNANRKYPGIPWRDFVPTDTFLRTYLEACSVDDVPEEFHFWNGLIALGLAVGPNRTLEDAPEVTANLFVCLVGGTGTGKSKSNRHLINVLLSALPYKPDDQPPYGAQYVKGVQSGEVLIKRFQHPMIDSSGKQIGVWPGVRGCIHFDELADLVGKSGRLGSTLKTTLMELYDVPKHLTSSSLTHGLVDAQEPFGSVVTTTQFKSIRNLITRSDDGSGFANRWVYATGVRKPQFSVNRVKVDLASSISKLTGLANSARAHTLVTWSTEAEQVWDDFYRSIFVPKRDSTDSSIIQRVDLLLKKLFLLFTVNKCQLTVSEHTVREVLSLYPYLMETYGRIDEEIASTQEGDDSELVLRQVERMSYLVDIAGNTYIKGPSPRDLYQSVRRRVSSMTKLRRTLENMVSLGLLVKETLPQQAGKGRVTERYRLPNQTVFGPAPDTQAQQSTDTEQQSTDTERQGGTK